MTFYLKVNIFLSSISSEVGQLLENLYLESATEKEKTKKIIR